MFKTENESELIIYFRTFYIGVFETNTSINNTLTPPRFPIEFWNCRDRVLKEIPYTNNILEGWNNKLNTRASISHPNIALFRKLLLDLEIDDKFQITRGLMGHLDWQGKYKDKAIKLKFIIENDSYFEGEDFITALLKVYIFKFD